MVNQTRIGLAATALLIAAATPAAAQDNPFAGETITYVVATEAGGGYDTYGRMVAQYMEKHLPGTTIVVRNMPGAGHIIGANHIFAAEPDGLTIGTFNTGLIYAQLLGLEGVQFNLREMSWIGKAASDPRVFVVRAGSGIETVDDLRNAAEPVKIAASGVGSASYNDLLLLADALELNVQLIPGFSGREDEMSMRRGEVDGTVGSYSSFIPFVEQGQGKFLFAVGGAVEGVPDVREFVTDDGGGMVANLVGTMAEIGRLTAGPPGIPEDRLQALRAAYEAALSDPELLAEAEAGDRPINPLYGDELDARIDEALNVSPDVVTMVAGVMNAEVPTITVRTALLEVLDEGRTVKFMSGDTQIQAAVSGSRTQITIGGTAAERAQLVAGMNCEITFAPGGENEPSLMTCTAP